MHTLESYPIPTQLHTQLPSQVIKNTAIQPTLILFPLVPPTLLHLYHPRGSLHLDILHKPPIPRPTNTYRLLIPLYPHLIPHQRSLILHIDIILLRRQALARPTIPDRAFAPTAATIAALAALAAFAAAAVEAAEEAAGVSDEGAVGGEAGADDGDVGFGRCLRVVNGRREGKVGRLTDPDVIADFLGGRRRVANVLGDDGDEADDGDHADAGGC
jgi:hypothetical protein